MEKRTSFYHRIGFKIKKIPLQNLSPENTSHEISSQTPINSKKCSSPGIPHHITSSFTSNSPINGLSRLNSIHSVLPNHRVRAPDLPPVNKMPIARTSRKNLIPLELIQRSDTTSMEGSDEKRILNIKHDKSPNFVYDSKLYANTPSSRKNNETPKKLGLTSLLSSKANEIMVISNSLPTGQSSESRRSSSPKNLKDLKTQGEYQHDSKKIIHTSEPKEERSHLKYTIFQKTNFVLSSEDEKQLRKNVKRFKLNKLKIHNDVEDDHQISRQALTTKRTQPTETKGTTTIEDTERSHEYSLLRLIPSERISPSPEGKKKAILKMMKRKENKDDLSARSEYGWRDRHNLTIIKNTQEKFQIKARGKIGLEDLTCFTNLATEYSPKSKRTIIRQNTKKSKQDNKKELNKLRELCKEVANMGSAGFLNTKSSSRDIVVEENIQRDENRT